MGILADILVKKRAELPTLRARKLPAAPSFVPPVQLKRSPGEPLHLICEIKNKSPSAGVLSTHLSITERARQYEKSGASMISVLCDGPFFDGSFEHLLKAREGCALPLLCKEFVVDECQLDAAQAYGASAVLLIARCLSEERLAQLLSEATLRGLCPVVEVFTEIEALQSIDAGASFVGVNARDLDTLEMNAERAAKIIDLFPSHMTVAHLSGIKSTQDAQRVAQGRADAALIGEVLMRQDDPGPLLESLVEAAR